VQFIPLAEETGLVISLGMSVLKEACRQMHEWHNEFSWGPKLSVSVNLSGKQLQQPNLVEQIRNTLRQTNLDPECLHLEITESVIMEKAQEVTEMLAQLKVLGVKLAIDDFGTAIRHSAICRFSFRHPEN
jgi:EAL domain-containing protein (putative c-di-GMP-specific phosphodiesterase class I)